MTWNAHYDVLVVGAGIAGSALAHALATLPRPAPPPPDATSSQGAYETGPYPRPLRVCVLERSLAPPDRIVGELLQPGGVRALRTLGLGDCVDGIDAVPVRGYAVVKGAELVEIPYPPGAEGRSFHHGRFVGKLRDALYADADAGRKAGDGAQAHVDVIEASVTELIECEFTNRVIGVRATRKAAPADAAAAADDSAVAGTGMPPLADDVRKEAFFADLVVIADGCFSNFRSQVLGPAAKPVTKSHFVGLVLEDVTLPIPHHGTVCLVKNSGPVLLYQIAARDTRMLVDVKKPLPSDLKGHILANIVPQLPPSLQAGVRTFLEKDRLKQMPNSFLPPTRQAKAGAVKEGVVLIGDSWNMRHPLTGGGMTVALGDVALLAPALVALGPGERGLGDWDRVRHVLQEWEDTRRPMASTINILSVALYDLFGAEDEALDALRTGCFKYFELGGDCVGGPVSLLSGLTPSPALLFRHFFAVAFYSIWVMFMHARPVPKHATLANGHAANGNGHRVGEKVAAPAADDVEWVTPSVLEYPALCMKAIRVFWTACLVFGPLMWVELRWW